ncbi:hypothetical protein LCGC14_3120530, partial [marine sediment metagenome]
LKYFENFDNVLHGDDTKECPKETLADEVIKYLHSQGVVIRVDIPKGWLLVKPSDELTDSWTKVAIQSYPGTIVAVESLIKEE